MHPWIDQCDEVFALIPVLQKAWQAFRIFLFVSLNR